MGAARAVVITGSCLAVLGGVSLGLVPIWSADFAAGTGWREYGAWGLTALGALGMAAAVALAVADPHVRSRQSGQDGAVGHAVTARVGGGVLAAPRAVTASSARPRHRRGSIVVVISAVALVAGTFLGLLPIDPTPHPTGSTDRPVALACETDNRCPTVSRSQPHPSPIIQPGALTGTGPLNDGPPTLSPTSWTGQPHWRRWTEALLIGLGVLGLIATVAAPLMVALARAHCARRAGTAVAATPPAGTGRRDGEVVEPATGSRPPGRRRTQHRGAVICLTAISGLAVVGGALLGLYPNMTSDQHTAALCRPRAEDQPYFAEKDQRQRTSGTPDPRRSSASEPSPDPTPLPRSQPALPTHPAAPMSCAERGDSPPYSAWGLTVLGTIGLALALCLALATRPNWRAQWRASRRRFDALRAAYATYECDPSAVLQHPALADVTVASTGRFVDAFAQAQALHTEHEDREPPQEHATSYIRAVDRAWQAWRAAQRSPATTPATQWPPK